MKPRVVYRREYEDGYTFMLVELESGAASDVEPGELERMAEAMHGTAKMLGACSYVVTANDERDRPIVVFGVVCWDCGGDDGEGERLLCELAWGGHGGG